MARGRRDLVLFGDSASRVYSALTRYIDSALNKNDPGEDGNACSPLLRTGVESRNVMVPSPSAIS
jgi:hypothetical protein